MAHWLEESLQQTMAEKERREAREKEAAERIRQTFGVGELPGTSYTDLPVTPGAYGKLTAGQATATREHQREMEALKYNLDYQKERARQEMISKKARLYTTAPFYPEVGSESALAPTRASVAAEIESEKQPEKPGFAAKEITPAPATPTMPGAGGTDTSYLSKLQKETHETRLAREAREAEMNVPYTGVVGEDGKFIEPGGIGEAETLTAKPDKTRAEVERLKVLGVESATAVGIEKAQAEFAKKQENDKLLRAEEEKQQKMVADQMIAGKEAEDKLAVSIDEYDAMEIDPQNFFQDSRAVYAAIGVALGAVGQAFQQTSGVRGAQNQGLVAMNKAIDRDMMAQRMNIDKAGKAIGMKRNLLSDMYRRFGNEQSAELATLAMMTHQGIRSLDLIGSSYAAPEKQAALQMTKAALLDQEQTAKQQLYEHEYENKRKDLVVESNIAARRAALAQAARAQAAAQAAQAGVVEKPEEIEMGNFVPFRKVGKDEMKEARDVVDKTGEIVAALNSLVGMRAKYGWIPWPKLISDRKAEVDSHLTDLQMLMKDGYRLGVLSGKDLDLIEKLQADPSSIENAMPQLKANRVIWTGRFQRQMHTRGFRPQGATTKGKGKGMYSE